MNYSIELQPNITYEPPDKRKFYRFIAPLTVVINKQEYKTVDWSVEAFKITGYKGDLKVNDTIHADMDINFQGIRFILRREVKILRMDKGKGLLVAKYTDENPRNHSALISLSKRLVTGEYQSVGDIISHIDIPINDNYIQQTFQDRDKPETHEIKRISYVWGFVAAGIIVLYLILSGVINSYFFLKTEFAAISGGTEAITSLSGGIVADIYVKEGEFVQKGQPLFRISSPKFEQEIEHKRNEILKNQALLEEKQRTMASSASETTLSFLKTELAKKMLLYERQLATEPEINRLKMEIHKQEGNQASLQAEIERIQKVIDINKKEFDWLEAVNERNTVKASFKAVVKEIPAFEGKFADERTPVVVLKSISGEKQVKAYITKKEALELRLGAETMIEIPSRNLKMRGKLVRLEEEQQIFNKDLAVAVVRPEKPQLIEDMDEGTPIKLTITKRKWF